MSQIMPPLTLKVSNKQYDKETDNSDTTNNIIEIINGKYTGKINTPIFT